MDKFFRIWWPSHIAWTFYSTHFKEVKRPCNFWTNGQIALPGIHQIMVVFLQPANLAQALFLPKDQMLQNIFYISYGDGTVASKITKFEFSKSVFYVNNLTFFFWQYTHSKSLQLFFGIIKLINEHFSVDIFWCLQF